MAISATCMPIRSFLPDRRPQKSTWANGGSKVRAIMMEATRANVLV